MFPEVVVIGFNLWKYATGSDLLGPNLDCKISCKVFVGGSSHCFASIRKLGKHRSSERLKTNILYYIEHTLSPYWFYDPVMSLPM